MLVGSMKMFCVGADRRVRPRLTDSSYGIGFCGITAYPLSAFTEHATPRVTKLLVMITLLPPHETKILCRGGPLRPPVLIGMFHANALWDSMKMLCVGADRRVRPC
jgi:hypothetical protein